MIFGESVEGPLMRVHPEDTRGGGTPGAALTRSHVVRPRRKLDEPHPEERAFSRIHIVFRNERELSVLADPENREIRGDVLHTRSVFGRQGLRVFPHETIGRRNLFEFMSSPVSSEKPKGVTVREIAIEVRELAGRAREKKLKPEEYTGATFSISNLGMFGIVEFTAIINPPEAAILAIGAAEEKVVAENGEMVVRPRMRMTMSCDHRVVDGAMGAKFLQTVRELIEDPMMMIA